MGLVVVRAYRRGLLLINYHQVNGTSQVFAIANADVQVGENYQSPDMLATHDSAYCTPTISNFETTSITSGFLATST